MKSLTKKLLAGATVSAMLFSLTACGGGTDTGSASGSAAGSAAATGTTYKVGIVQYVSDASLDQISNNIK